jgi:CRISPR/Cas system-associated protein endoribonuclease Cas2
MEKRTAMSKELKAKYDVLKDECQHVGYFNMVVSYLLQKGYENVLEITEKQIANMKRKLEKEEQELKTQHKISLMTPEFQVWLVEMAIKLAKIGKLFDLLKYIQNEMWLG